MVMDKKRDGDPQHTLVIRDRDLKGEVTGERTITARSIDEAFKLSSVRRVTFDGHLMKDVLRTVTGLDMKSFCNQKFEIAVGEESSPERESYMERSKVAVSCWKCKDRWEMFP
jgi:hypothetical protein